MVLNSNAETVTKYSYLQLGEKNNWLYAVMTIFLQRFSICSLKFWGRRRLSPHLATRLATVTDYYVVLILVLQLQTRKHLTPATERQFRHG